MKKTKFILLCVLMIVLASCNSTGSPPTLTDTDIGCGNEMLYIKSLDEYSEYISDKTKPEGFVLYEMLSDIGEFSLFIPFDKDGVIYNYTYSLATKNGSISIDVTHNENLINSDITYLQSPPPEGFAYADDFKNTAVSYNGIIYVYQDSGRLAAIFYIFDNVTISIEPRFPIEEFSEYKFENDNLVTCLLSGNEDNVDIVSRYLTERSEE